MKNQEKKVSFFKRMFMDENDINEKSIVGFASFMMMVVCLAVDIGQASTVNKCLLMNLYLMDLWLSLWDHLVLLQWINI